MPMPSCLPGMNTRGASELFAIEHVRQVRLLWWVWRLRWRNIFMRRPRGFSSIPEDLATCVWRPWGTHTFTAATNKVHLGNL